MCAFYVVFSGVYSPAAMTLLIEPITPQTAVIGWFRYRGRELILSESWGKMLAYSVGAIVVLLLGNAKNMQTALLILVIHRLNTSHSDRLDSPSRFSFCH